MMYATVALAVIAALGAALPAYAQETGRIAVPQDFGVLAQGEPLFIFGEVAAVSNDIFLVMQIHNPAGDLCQIQQLTPLPDGVFVTDAIPLKGRVCGIVGQYEVGLFYGNDTASSAFALSAETYSEPSEAEMLSTAGEVLAVHAGIVAETSGVPNPVASGLPTTLGGMEEAFADLWEDHYNERLLFEISPLVRPAVSSALASVDRLLADGEITADVASEISRQVHAATFRYEAGDKDGAIGTLSDAIIDLRNVTPEKPPERRLSYEQLAESLSSLSHTTNTIFSRDVREDIAKILARGTAPVHTENIEALSDMLSKARYLDVVSRKTSDLYTIVDVVWDQLKGSLASKDSIADLLEARGNIDELHEAALILRDLVSIERYVDPGEDEEGEDQGPDNKLVELLLPEWERLEERLVLATSPSDILDAREEIRDMVKVIKISSRIGNIMEISSSKGLDSSLVPDWASLLERVEDAGSLEEVLGIVSEVDTSIRDLREKRSPLETLEFRYLALKQKAELQADYANLFHIENALDIIRTAVEMEGGSPSATRIDRIELLLAWVSQQEGLIREDLDSYGKEDYERRANDILTRVNSVANLAETGLINNRFLPNYTDYVDSVLGRVSEIRALVIDRDLQRADDLARELADEWETVTAAYADDPHGSPVGYSIEELQRIEFREKLDDYSVAVSTFNHPGFSEHSADYYELTNEAYDMVEIGNFVDAKSKIHEIGEYLEKHLAMSHDDLIYDITYDADRSSWFIEGFVNKETDRRQKIDVTVYNMNGTVHSTLQFLDTSAGRFYTQWEAPADPGLFVAQLQHGPAQTQATRIIHVEAEFEHDIDDDDLDAVGLSREFGELEAFAEEFGGSEFSENPRFADTIDEIKEALADRRQGAAARGLEELRGLIERYLPVRSPGAVIEAEYGSGGLVLSGAVEKSVEFSEDLYVDIYDQRGERAAEAALKDNAAGFFSQQIVMSFEPGLYAAQLEYHGTVVNDFFRVPKP